MHQRRCLLSRRNKALSCGLCETRFVERYVLIPVKHSKLGAKNFNKVCPKTDQNTVKWPLQFVNFLKISGERARGPCGAFLFLDLLQINSPAKTKLENMSKFGALSLNKLLITPHFQRAYLRSFPRLDIRRFCIYSSKHSTYIKIASPHQNFF